MQKSLIIPFIFFFVNFSGLYAQDKSDFDNQSKKAFVSYDDFEALVREVKSHREKRLLNVDEFAKLMNKKNVVILDTRSKAMYEKSHIKGAVHLTFADFTQENLAKVIPSCETKILIYCNNNIEDDPIAFATKMVSPSVSEKQNIKQITLALNIPTYINLYGYGYRNIYELADLISVFDSRIKFVSSEK